MKGDFILLGITGLAILAVPMTVLVGSGAELPAFPATVVVGVPSQASQSEGERWPSASLPVVLPDPAPTPDPAPLPTTAPTDPPPLASAYKNTLKAFKIFNRGTGKVDTVPVLDYLRGAIAAEMPATFHLEALKAQGVAALTYAYYHAEQQTLNPDPLLQGAHFSADPDKREGYMTEKAAKRFYGENKDYNWSKICKAADEALQWVILYEGRPIAAAYHAISAGSTEDAANIWEQPLPCLTSVDSSGDILAKGYKSSEILSQSEIKEKLKDTGVTLLPNADTWFRVKERSSAGYVTRVQVGNQVMNGNRLRNLLGLRSSSFQIERQGKDFLFLVCGYGHGAGLSQNGADYMARQGSDYREILEHYYPGGSLVRLMR